MGMPRGVPMSRLVYNRDMTSEEELELIRQVSFDARLEGEIIQQCITKAIDLQASETTLDILRDIELLHNQLSLAKENNHNNLVELGRLLREKARR
jgi:5,10-methylene-tetrahydrofolate dehydrogenase/methenyl tetrahydrofolate cyclohydrolase